MVGVLKCKTYEIQTGGMLKYLYVRSVAYLWHADAAYGCYNFNIRLPENLKFRTILIFQVQMYQLQRYAVYLVSLDDYISVDGYRIQDVRQLWF